MSYATIVADTPWPYPEGFTVGGANHLIRGRKRLPEERDIALLLTVDALWPRDEEHRYRLYGRRGRDLEILAATPTAGGIGEAIVQLDADERLAGGDGLPDRGAFGVLDVVERRWLVLPWHRPDYTTEDPRG